MLRWLVLLLALVAGPASAESFTVESPSKVLAATVTVENGRATYRVDRFGDAVVLPSRLGFKLYGAPPLERGLTPGGAATRSVDETWDLPWGERSTVKNRFNELRVTLTESAGLKRRFDVVFRAYDDGLGFRYEAPAQPNLKSVAIAEELTEFRLAAPASTTAWWIPTGHFQYSEQLYRQTPLTEVSQAHTPLTMRTGNGLHLSLHEAALVNYAGADLRTNGQGALQIALTPSAVGAPVKVKTPFVTPWRTLQVSDTAAGLITGSDLILNLNEPNRLGDVSWVKPGKYVGIWWAMHLNEATWGSGPKHGATTENAKRHVDFAAKHGFDAVLVEGWNTGWDGDWFSNGEVFSFTEPYPDYDLVGVTKYAAEKGVKIVGHNETSGAITNYERQMAAAYDLYRSLGIDTIKTGYVADDGRILRREKDGTERREHHQAQAVVEHYNRSVVEAAKRKIAVNTHEPVKDTGLRRTWPNWVSREGARGQEFNAWGQPPNPPSHVATLPFTRMLSGPMDYTPGIFDVTRGANPGSRVQSTIAQQLALYVVLYSPVQMAADLPENYEKRPDLFQFVKDVATDWSETVPLAGEVGDYVVIARKAKGTEDWFLGAVTDELGRHLPTKLSFLTPGVTYRAQVYRDGPSARWDTAPYDYVIEEVQVTSADVLPIRLAPGGGAAVRFVPVR
jgi:alpha-glucosidase